MNKKGFTLIEILAVIAIIALLVVFTMPNIIKRTVAAKKDALVIEGESIYDSIVSNLLKDLFDNEFSNGLYCKTETEQEKLLNITNDKNLDYKILVEDGKIVYFHVANKNYSIFLKNYEEGIKKEDIKEVSENYIAVSNCNKPSKNDSYSSDYVYNHGDDSFDEAIKTIITGYKCSLSPELKITSEKYFSFDTSTRTITNYNKEGPKDVVIPCQIAGVNVKAIDNNAFASKSITSVIMPDTITYIGSNAFSSNAITNLELSSTIETIGAGAFYNNQIVELYLPNSLKNIESSTSTIPGAFENNKLTKVVMGKNIETIGSRAFIGAVNYNNINYLNIKSSENLSKIATDAFYNNDINSLIINSSKNLVIENNAFKDNKLAILNIKSSNLSMGNEVFSNNIIEDLKIDSKIVSIGKHAFRNNQLSDDQAFIMNKDTNGNDTSVLNSYGGSNRSNISIPSKVKSLSDDAFKGLALTGTINTGNGLTKIGNSVFDSNMLENVIIGDAATQIGNNAFSNNRISKLKIGSSLKYIYNNAFASNKITELKLNNVIESINSGAFYDNQITEVNFPDSFVAINFNTGNGAFEKNKLKKVTFGKNLEVLGSRGFIGGTDYNQITELDISKSEKLRFIGRDVFADNLLTEVTLPKSLKEISMDCTSSLFACGAFRNNNITKLTINSESLSIGESVFANNKISELKINGKIVAMKKHAFHNNQLPDSQAFIMNKNADGSDTNVLNSYGGSNRSNITIPEYVKSIATEAFTNLSLTGILNTGNGLEIIEAKTFANNMLEKVIIGNGAVSIGKNAFANNKISSLTIGNRLETIEAGAFCNNLITNLVFPDSLKTIGSSGSGYKGAFEVNKLNSVTFGSGITSIGNTAFYGVSTGNQITKLDLSKSNKLETIGVDVFAYNKISELSLPASLKSIPLGCTSTNIGCGAFRNNKITKLVINSNNIALGESVFANNLISDLKIVGKITAIGQHAFRNNQLPDDQAFFMDIDSNGNETDELNSYGGANRTNVTIPANVKVINSRVFNGLALTGTLNTGNGLVSVGQSAFQGNSLVKVIIGDAAESIERDAFSQNRITEVTMGKNVKIIKQGAFYSNRITKLTLNNKIETIYAGAFYVNKISELELPDSLKELTDPDVNVHGSFESNVLTKVTFGSGIEKIGNRSFSSDVGDNNLSIVDLTRATKLKYIGATAFYGNNLKEFTIPESTTTIGDDALTGNTELAKIFIRNKVDSSNFTSLGKNWNGSCNNIVYELTSCYTYSGNTITGYSTACGTDVIIPKKLGGNTITVIAPNAFKNKKLTSVVLPETITSIGSNAFAENDLKNIVVLGKYSKDSFESLGTGWNDNISVVYEKNLSTCLKVEGNTAVGYYYDTYNCNKDIVIPKTITAIAPNAFNDHVYDSITIQDGTRIKSYGANWNGTIYKVNFEGDSYDYNCFTLSGDKIVSYKNICSTTVDLTKGTVQGVTIKSIAPNAFKNMGVNIIKLSTDIIEIGDSAFEDNDLSSVYLKEGLISIGSKAFYNTGITGIALPASLQKIGSDAFAGNSKLNKITLFGKNNLNSFTNLGTNWNGTCNNIVFQN